MAMSDNTRRPVPHSGGQKRRKRRRRRESGIYLLTFIAVLAVCIITATVCIIAGCRDESDSESSFADNSSEPETTSSAGIPAESSKPEEASSTGNDSSQPDENSKADDSSQPEESSNPDESSGTEQNPIVQSEKTRQYEKFIGKKYVIDMNKYEDFVCPDNESDYVFLVNPSHPLSADYVPADLVKCTNMRTGRPEYWSYMNRVANSALEAFLEEAAYYGFDDITVTNAYRSYNSQKSLFEQYCKTEIASGKFETEEEAIAYVLTYSTRPGTSEHQSGLCCDMHNRPATNSSFNNTPEAIWLAENAHRFGFILRYPEGKQEITGIKHESWHFRYVGRTAATEMYKLGITLDEYLADEEAN